MILLVATHPVGCSLHGNGQERMSCACLDTLLCRGWSFESGSDRESWWSLGA